MIGYATCRWTSVYASLGAATPSARCVRDPVAPAAQPPSRRGFVYATAQRIFRRRALQSTYAPVTAPAHYVRARVRAKKAVRCVCPARVETDRRSAALPRRQGRGLHGPDRRRGGKQETGANLDGAPRGRHAPANHV